MICHYCGADHAADVVCQPMFMSHAQPYVRLNQRNPVEEEMSDTPRKLLDLVGRINLFSLPVNTAALLSRAAAEIEQLARELAAERQLKERAEAEAEQLRVQLAGCGVAAMGNTRASLARNKQVKQGDYGYSASYADCLIAAEREINERERAEKAEAELAVMSKRAQRMAQQCSLEHARWKQEEWRRENLESELAAVKEDAERFRWLRDEWFVSGKDFPWADYEIATNDQLNDAIDEQRKS